MALFTALAAAPADGAAEEGSTTIERPFLSSLSPRTAVQLYASRSLDFLSGTVTSPTTTSSSSDGASAASRAQRPFAVLSYQAVEAIDLRSGAGSGVGGEDASSSAGTTFDVGRRRPVASAAALKHLRPNLGVWDCRVAVDTAPPPGGSKKERGSPAAADNNFDADLASRLLRGVLLGGATRASSAAASSSLENGGSGGSDRGSAPRCFGVEGMTTNTFVLTVDLSRPSEVQPAVRQMQQVILAQFDGGGDSGDSVNGDEEGATAGRGITTSLAKLGASTFGRAPASSSPSLTPTLNGGGDGSHRKIGLVLCAIVPPDAASDALSDGPEIKDAAAGLSSSSPADAYRERQARALVLYHLHRFAHDVDCTLCFVRHSGDVGGGGGEMDGDVGATESMQSVENGNVGVGGLQGATLSVTEVAVVVRRVASGLSPSGSSGEEDDEEEGSGEESKADIADSSRRDSAPRADGGGTAPSLVDEARRAQPSLHPPGSHDAELIEGAYLRNASCEGRWDASKDDLWIAIPPSPRMGGAGASSFADSKKAKLVYDGDAAWLSKLAASVGGETEVGAAGGTTAKKEGRSSKAGAKKRPSAANTSKKTDDVAVSSFFENLLKKP